MILLRQKKYSDTLHKGTTYVSNVSLKPENEEDESPLNTYILNPIEKAVDATDKVGDSTFKTKKKEAIISAVKDTITPLKKLSNYYHNNPTV